MKILPFKASKDLSLGIELEYQIINPRTYNLGAAAKTLIRDVQDTKYKNIIKPEITQSMLEINSSIHNSANSLLQELLEIRDYLESEARKDKIKFCGGGTHPFEKWIERKIFPLARYRKLYRKFQYLSKRATVFGLHVHVGCSNTENSLYLTHMLARYVPQFLAISAGSPFYEGVDTGFNSTRVTVFNNFPLCGTIPEITVWDDFCEYFYKLKGLGIVESMKDFYWDIRPKPEFGTVEIRVCDTPLTIRKAVMIAAYIQALCCYLVEKHPEDFTKDIYILHNYNKFQGARYGYDGEIVNPFNFKKIKIQDDILATIKLIQHCAQKLESAELINYLQQLVENKQNDTLLLREILSETGSLKEVVHEQCKLWSQ